ncbi:hypothetical protein [Parablautia muri]|uniref:Uncharacterized protein n=1 Tax=Parablautia muri TaxID=2320879 RepID=A0A9X5GTA4_9FIRM|nr:hypothetical protein [Parablautia muri]NBJ93791.1 hypothetical protein [Parablautia muri]
MKQKNILKLAAATFAIIGAGTILFNAAGEVTLAANNGKVEKVPTSYQVSDIPETSLPKSETKEEGGGKEVNYFVSMDSLNTGTPTDTDLTMEEAAEIGAQYLRDIYGLDLEGAYVYMSYSPGTETFPRAFWVGDVLFEKEQTPESTRWNYLIDAVTGELFDICYGRQLDVSVPLGYDSALEKDYHLYAELAQKKTEECKMMDSPVERVEYNCQGYSGNDPAITMDVIGKNGEIVNITFSRYDQTFLGLSTDTSRKISESALMRLAGEAVESETENLEMSK